MKKVRLSRPGGTFAIALVVAGVVTSFAPAGAAVLNVNNQASCSDTTGSPNYCSIVAAAAVATAGDTVLVAAGVYNGKVAVTRSGTQNKPIKITTIAGAVVKSTSIGFNITGASWVTVRGFIIYKTQSDGIRCTLCSNVTLLENHVKNSNGIGISIKNSSDIVLIDNKVKGSRYTGIDVVASQRVAISGGFVTYSGTKNVVGANYKGIKFSGSSDSSVVDTRVHHNSDTGIYLLNATSGVRIKGVIAHHNERGYVRAAAGIEIRSPGNFVEGATAYQNEDSGINLRWGGSDGLVVNNIAYGNGDHGIDVLESPRPTIVNNSVYDNVTAGINVEGHSPDGVIMNNISVDNGIGSPRTLGNIRITGTSLAATADRNIVWGSDGGKVYHWNGIYFSNLSALQSAYPGVEANGFEVDPAWVDPDAGDFHPTAASVAIDSAASDAIASPEIDQDSEGNARCDDPLISDTGSGPISFTDRGALEHVNPC